MSDEITNKFLCFILPAQENIISFSTISADLQAMALSSATLQ